MHGGYDKQDTYCKHAKQQEYISMKKLQETIKEYMEMERREENKIHEYLEQDKRVREERADKRREFLSKDLEMDKEKVRLGDEILQRVTIFTSDEFFMKGLLIAGNPCRVRTIFDSTVKTEGEYLDGIRERLGHYKRRVTHVFGCNSKKDLIYYQYWTPEGYLEAIYCHGINYNESDKIFLRTPEDFLQISYDAVSAFHMALQGDDVIDRLIDRIQDRTDRRITYD